MKSMTLGEFRNQTNHLHDDVLVFITVGNSHDDSDDVCDTAAWEIHGAEHNPLNEIYGVNHISLFVPIDGGGIRCEYCENISANGKDCCDDCMQRMSAVLGEKYDL